MSPPQRHRLEDATRAVHKRVQNGVPSIEIIAELVHNHGARYRTGPDTNRLSCAGVTASCTWSADKGLLQAWRKNATVRLMEPADA